MCKTVPQFIRFFQGNCTSVENFSTAFSLLFLPDRFMFEITNCPVVRALFSNTKIILLRSLFDTYPVAVDVYPNGTVKKSSIRVGSRVLARSRLETDPNGTFTFMRGLNMKILSFGAGMQSTALALMSCENAMCRNKKEPYPLVPIYDAVIFCDLGLEPPWVKDQMVRP